MLLIYFITIGLAISILGENNLFSKFSQKDYQAKDVRVEFRGYNKKYMNYASVITYKYNRSTPAINGSINFKMNNMETEMQTLTQGYKLSSSGYRVFPIRFQAKFCEGMDNNVLGLKKLLVKCGNLTECKFKKDTLYHFCNFILDASKLPPLIPTGSYKIEVTIMHFDEFVFGYDIYGEAYRPMHTSDFPIGG